MCVCVYIYIYIYIYIYVCVCVYKLKDIKISPIIIVPFQQFSCINRDTVI